MFNQMKNFKLIDMYGKPGYMNPMRNYTNKCKCGNRKQFNSQRCKKCLSNNSNSGVNRMKANERKGIKRAIKKVYRILAFPENRKFMEERLNLLQITK